jgi:hypothetical protein
MSEGDVYLSPSPAPLQASRVTKQQCTDLMGLASGQRSAIAHAAFSRARLRRV